jgi:chromosome segregation ATPase
MKSERTYDMTQLNLTKVAAAIRQVEENGQKATVRVVSKFLKADTNRVNEAMRVLRNAQQAMIESKAELDPDLANVLVMHIEQAKTKASQQAELRAQAAEDALNALVTHVQELDATLVANDEELTAAQASLLHCKGQLQECVREVDEVRRDCATKTTDADARTSQALAQVQSLRLHLDRANLLLGTMPRLEAALEEAQQLAKAGQEELAQARQAAAVADALAKQLTERVRDAALLEGRTEAQRQRLQDELEKATAAERLARQEEWQLSAKVSTLEARCAEQMMEIAKLREAQNDAGDASPASVPSPHDQRRAS